jgi:8-oxo-dGTP pyrophosphatase MutT (NUDIX family)
MHCIICGYELEEKKENQTFRKCSDPECTYEHYENPIPVVVPLIRVRDSYHEVIGLLGTVRGIQPQKGKLAFPGGFQEIESCHQALNREVLEETGLDLVELFKTENLWEDKVIVKTTPDGRRNLMFFRCKHILEHRWIDFDYKNSETAAIKLIDIGDELAFPLHQAHIKWGLKC